MTFDPIWLAKVTGGVWENGVPQGMDGFAFDARTLQVGQCFIALTGGARDGHEFAAQALKQGASALLVEKCQSLHLPQLVVSNTLRAMADIARAHRQLLDSDRFVVGVTGSCGKTSTKEMLRDVLGGEQTHATEGNWNNLIGVPMTLFQIDSSVHRNAVIEAGINQPGEMEQLGQMICADLVICTNIGSAHLELLESLAGIADEKSKLLECAKPDTLLVAPMGIFKYAAFRRYVNRALVLRPENDKNDRGEFKSTTYYRLEEINNESTKLILRNGDRTTEFTVPSTSEGMCLNAGLVIVAARELGVEDGQIAKNLLKWAPSDNRGKVVVEGSRTFYVDCYNANPTSMLDALNAFARRFSSEGPRYYVLGAMNELGASAESLHRLVGESLVLRSQDLVCFVGPDALVEAYVSGALEAGILSQQISIANSIDLIRSTIEKFHGTLFLKGSRTYRLESLLSSPS